MEDSKPSENKNPDAKLEDDSTRFTKSLLELKDLCSQLHHAADYCETSFLNAEQVQKKAVMENTKEYLCRAVVTVVDHLGSVSANLDSRLSNDNIVSETEIRINGLTQRLVTCNQYSHQLALTKVSWNANFPRYNLRYIFPPMVNRERSMELFERLRDVWRFSRATALAESCFTLRSTLNAYLSQLEGGTPVAAKTIRKHEFEAEEDVPLFLYTSNRKPSLIKNSSTETDEPSSTSVLPVRDGLSVLPKASNPSFHFEGTHKLKRNTVNWKSVQNSDIVSLIRKAKRAM